MSAIVLKVRFAVKERLLKNLRRCRNAGVRLRYLIVLNVLNKRSAQATAGILGVHNTTVYRVLKRFRAYGEAGLEDGRADNGADKLKNGTLTFLTQDQRKELAHIDFFNLGIFRLAQSLSEEVVTAEMFCERVKLRLAAGLRM